MRSLGVIPARGGSKGIPRKNVRELCGKPLIQYTIDVARASNLTHVVVSSEDEEVCRVARQCGCDVVERPPELAADDTPTLPVLQHALRAQGENFDCVVTLQPTSPLRQTRHINESLELFDRQPHADSLVSVVRVPHNMCPESLMKSDGDAIVPYLNQVGALRRQDKVQNLYARNGAAVYITRVSRITDYIFGGRIIPYVMPTSLSFDIDDESDWQLAEVLMPHALSGSLQ
ncbi:MAG: acylneuraminate cytidylyltransferase family protein [Fuerstiella sp.]